jgi:hypothetical protein
LEHRRGEMPIPRNSTPCTGRERRLKMLHICSIA